MSKYQFLLALCIPILFGCSENKTKSVKEVITINITEALKNHKEFPMSKFVKDVEILELESNEKCFMQYPLLWHFGKKYILMFDMDQTQIVLFDRKGKFINKIGRPGKGPGEYNGMMLKGTMSKDEKNIFITDHAGRIAIVYDLEGNVRAQKDISEHFSSKYILDMDCHFDKLISIAPHRPWKQDEGFSSVVMFDMDLNKVEEVLPRANDENLTLENQHLRTFENSDGAYFWEIYNDTIYQYFENGQSLPKYRLQTDKNKLIPEALDNWDVDIYNNYVFPWYINFVSDYLMLHLSGSNHRVFYDLKTGESFSVGEKISCFIETERSQAYDCIKNDVFGFEPIRFFQYSPEDKACIESFEWGRLSTTLDLECIRKLDVTHPEIRDQLLEYCENPSEDLGAVLLIMKM